MQSPELIPFQIQLAIEVVATLAFALSGIIEGARKQLDAVGVVVVAFLAAFGGGTLRDLLLDRRPFFWVANVEVLWLVLGSSALAMLLMRQKHLPATEKMILWPDTIGLGLFTASGVYLADQLQMPALVAVLMGVITGVFGGVLRDIVCNEIPNAFKDHRPYALCAFAGAWVFMLGLQLNWSHDTCTLASAASTVLLRAFAIQRNITLPRWRF